VYVLHLERLERMVVAEQQVAATYASAGADVDPPRSVEEAIRVYDLALSAAPAPETANARLLRRLGVS